MANSLQKDEGRLSRTAVPSHYNLTIRTDLAAHTFSGVGDITLHVAQAIPYIVLHAAAPLQLHAAVLIEDVALGLTTKRRKATQIEVDEKKERVKLYFDGGLAKGTYRLALRWGGKLDGSMKGYYLSSYPSKHDKNETSYYAVTQHQPTSARRSYPCFDEPEYKATYSITLLSRKGTVSLSNSAVESTKASPVGDLPRSKIWADDLFEPSPFELSDASAEEEKTISEIVDEKPSIHSPEWELVTFSTTPKISSYLIAFANGDLDYKESSFVSTTGRTVPLRFYATYDQIEQTAFALGVTEKLVPMYEKIFDIPYPLEKLWTLVVSDFDLGAMENWGLITGRTSVYCCDPSSASLQTRKGVVGTTSHEIAHSWFGDLVSPGWWDNLWLNESFATLVGELLLIDRIEPTWRAHSTFLTDYLGRALSLDSLRSSHPIEMPCPDEATIQQIFDAVSYAKGASVLRMLSAVMGEEKFLEGVTIYLKAHLYGTATTADLFAGLTEASCLNVAEMMESWTKNIGYPLLTITETDEGINVRQNRYLASRDATPEEDETIWHVPLQLLLVDEDDKSTVGGTIFLKERESFFPIAGGGTKGLYKINAGATGVYRTLYPAERLEKLAKEAIKPDSSLTLDDRVNLLQDASALSRSGHLRTSSALTLIRTLHGVEKASLVWEELLNPLSELSDVWWEQSEEVQKALTRLRREMVQPVVERLGWEERKGEGEDERELRWLALEAAAWAGEKEVADEYKRRFNLLLEQDDDSIIPSDLRRSIFRFAVRHGGRAEYEKVLSIYRSPPTPAHKSACIAALGEVRDPELLRRTMEFVLGKEVKTQDVRNCFSAIAGNSKARRALWELLKREYEPLVKRFAGNFQIGSVIKTCFASFSTEEDAVAVEAFFADKDTSLYNQALLQGIESIRSNASWLTRDGDDVRDWLKENGYLE